MFDDGDLDEEKHGFLALLFGGSVTSGLVLVRKASFRLVRATIGRG
jgi:hypothetical protein